MSINTLADFATADYRALFPDGDLFSLFSHPAVPIVSVFLYLTISTPVFNYIAKTFSISPKGKILQWFVIIHSAALAIYSAWTCVNSVRIVGGFVSEFGLWGTVCAQKETLWVQHGLTFWAAHFYISKYYEFIDTWITLLKGRVPILLQTFHHAGICLLMYFLCVTHSSPVFVVICWNSFIHTLMYSYYVLAAFGINTSLKHYLTQMQIGQLVTGLCVTIPSHFITGCLNEAQHWVIGFMELYTVILIGLFGAFYVSSYSKKSASPKKKE